jgi:hypothetical protein
MLTAYEPAGIIPVSVPLSTPVPVLRLIVTVVLLLTLVGTPLTL